MPLVPWNDGERERIRNEIREVSNRDNLGIFLRSAFGGLPVIGSAITELVNVVIPNSSFERLLDFTLELREDLARLEIRINQDYLRSDAGAYMVREILTGVMANYQKEKLEALRAVFLNSIVNSSRRDEEKELLLNIAKNLTGSHVKMLRLLDDPAGFLTQRQITYRAAGPGGLIQILEPCLPELNRGQISSIWNDLYNAGLVNTEPRSLGAINSSTELLQLNRLTSFGRDFVTFIKAP